MAIKVKGPHSGPKAAVKAFAKARGSNRIEEVDRFVDQLYSQNLFDAFMICAQSSHETTSWTSPIWTSRLNPGGVGVTDGADYGYGFPSGTEAAKAMLIHHCAYTGTPVPAEWQDWVKLDPRFQAVKDAGFYGKVQNWEQYGNGYWATDPNYYQGIMNHVAAIKQYSNAEEEGGGTNVYQPNIIDMWLHEGQNYGGQWYAGVNRRYIGRGGMSPKVIFLHIQEGYNGGSWQWFHQTTASCTVEIAKNGDIWRLVPEEDGPWTNGDVSNPTALGRQVLNTYGPDPNYYTLSIETEGFTQEWPKPQAQLDAVVWQIKTWMKKYDIPLERVLRHADVNQTSRPNCPGNTYYNYVIDRIKREGTGDVPVTPTFAEAKKIAVNGKLWDGKKDVVVNDITFHAQKQSGIKATSEAVVHQYATKDSAPTRSNIKKNTTFSVLGWVNGEEVGGEKRWWITINWGRVWVGNTQQKPNDIHDAEDDVPQELPSGVKILNGRVYYPVREGETLEREIVVTENAPLRKSATPRSDKVGTMLKGTKAHAVYFTVGDEENDESIWYVLKVGTKDALTQGPRINASHTNARPD